MAVAGAVLAAGGLLNDLISLLNIPEELKPMAAPMMRIYAAGLMFHYGLINSNGILRSCNRIKSSLKTMALVCGINIALNFFFLFQTALGFKGIALSTAVSVSIGSLVNLAHLKKVTGGKPFPLISSKRCSTSAGPLVSSRYYGSSLPWPSS
jgi:Na+-driven multidrug efflux pump